MPVDSSSYAARIGCFYTIAVRLSTYHLHFITQKNIHVFIILLSYDVACVSLALFVHLFFAASSVTSSYTSDHCSPLLTPASRQMPDLVLYVPLIIKKKYYFSTNFVFHIVYVILITTDSW